MKSNSAQLFLFFFLFQSFPLLLPLSLTKWSKQPKIQVITGGGTFFLPFFFPLTPIFFPSAICWVIHYKSLTMKRLHVISRFLQPAPPQKTKPNQKWKQRMKFQSFASCVCDVPEHLRIRISGGNSPEFWNKSVLSALRASGCSGPTPPAFQGWFLCITRIFSLVQQDWFI